MLSITLPIASISTRPLGKRSETALCNAVTFVSEVIVTVYVLRNDNSSTCGTEMHVELSNIGPKC